MTLPLEQWLPEICDLADAAGQCIMEVYTGEYYIEHKENNTPVTDADYAAHHAILDGLARLTPDLPALSEESEDIPFEQRAQWNTYWLVDPLDGTREFIKRNGEFTVNIALIHQHEAILGVIHCPVSGVTYYASRGRGAWRLDRGGTPQPIQVQSHATLPLRVASSRSYNCESIRPFLNRIGEFQLLNIGSSLKSCLVAEGKADIYPRFGPTCEWDTAAAQCIVEEAGGRIVDVQMQPLRYNTKPSLLNPHFLAIGDVTHDWRRFLD